MVVFLILIPLPLFFAHTIFGKRGLTAWITIEMIWTFCAAFTVVIYPLYESRVALTLVCKGIMKVNSQQYNDSLVLTVFVL